MSRFPGGRAFLPVVLSVFMTIIPFFSSNNSVAAVTQDDSDAQVDMYYGDNWDSMRTFQLTRTSSAPLKVYIDHSSTLYRGYLKDYVAQSLDAWSNALDGRLTYELVTSRADANITVAWTAHFSDPY